MSHLAFSKPIGVFTQTKTKVSTTTGLVVATALLTISLTGGMFAAIMGVGIQNIANDSVGGTVQMALTYSDLPIVLEVESAPIKNGGGSVYVYSDQAISFATYGFVQFPATSLNLQAGTNYYIWIRQARPSVPAVSQRGIYLYNDKHVLISDKKVSPIYNGWYWTKYNKVNQPTNFVFTSADLPNGIVIKGDGQTGIVYADKLIITKNSNYNPNDSELKGFYVEAENANVLNGATVVTDTLASGGKKISYNPTQYVYGFAQFDWVWNTDKTYSVWTRQYRPTSSNRGIYLYTDKHVLIANSWKQASTTNQWQWVYHGNYTKSQFGSAIVAKGDGKGGALYLDKILIADQDYNPNLAKVDLAVTSIDVSPVSPAANQPATIMAMIVNSGSEPITLNSDILQYGIDFPDFKITSSSTPISATGMLLPGQSLNYTFRGNFTGSGTKSLAFVIDAQNKLVEVNENNNLLTKVVNIGLPVEGRLSISSDSTTPSAGLMPANTSGVTLAIFKAVAINEDINIEKIYLTGEAVNNGGWDQINKLYLYVNATKFAEVTPTSTDGINKTVLIDLVNNPIRVPKDSTTGVKLTFKADTADSNAEISSKGASGQGIKLKITNPTDITAKGVSSAGPISNITVTNASGFAQYLFKSIPFVTLSYQLPGGVTSGSIMPGGEAKKTLYAFAVTAYSSGDIALYKVTFQLDVTNVKVDTLSLYDEAGNNISSSPVQLENQNNYIVPLMFTENIPAGQTRKFYLKAGSVLCAQSCVDSGASISVRFMGDGGFPYPLPGVIQPTTLNGSFIWTDYYRSLVGSDFYTSAQWANGYLVPLVDGSKMPAVTTPIIFSR